MPVIAAAILWLAVSSVLLALAYRRALSAAWREPVLRVPVLILESDDWGYGPVEQAQRLDQIGALLARFRDSRGSHPVMTLGVVLAGPDTERMRAERCRTYHRVTLADPQVSLDDTCGTAPRAYVRYRGRRALHPRSSPDATHASRETARAALRSDPGAAPARPAHNPSRRFRGSARAHAARAPAMPRTGPGDTQGQAARC